MKRYIDETLMPADYIIETGTSKGWDYEKWLSGKYICRRVYTETLEHYTTVGNFYGYVSSPIDYPFTFSSTPILIYNTKVGNGFAIGGGTYKSERAIVVAMPLLQLQGNNLAIGKSR